MTEPLTVGRVFVPGGAPTVTYNPRAELKLETQLADYLDERHRILSVSGPTKTGKTVLLRRNLPGALWVSGGTVQTLQDFWGQVADRLGVFTDLGESRTDDNSTGRTGSGSLGVAGTSVGGELTSGTTVSITNDRRVTRPIAMAARDALLESKPILVIDDFHYIPVEVQLAIVRNLKDLIFEGLPVIVAAVPHRAYDVVRVEKEMTGRVQQLDLGFWSHGDLEAIASAGFAALNIADPLDLRKRLADESFQSPHLMQEFCLALCKQNGLREAADPSRDLASPADWPTFFSERASATSRSAFELLARGPRQRADRKVRVLSDGTRTDIYGVVLAAIAATGPLTEMTYEQLRAKLREVMSSEPPQRHEVTRVLDQLAEIARKDIEGEPVVDYVSALGTLYISDPFFAYYLRWQANPNTGTS